MPLLFAYGINRFSHDVAQILLTHYKHTLQRLQIKGWSNVYFRGEGLSTDKQPRDTSPVKLHIVSARTDNIWYFHLSLGWSKWESWSRLHTWTASSEFCTYHLCEQRRMRTLARTSAARSYKQWVKRNLQTESQIPGLSEWLGMRS